MECFYERRIQDVANNKLDYVRHSKYLPSTKDGINLDEIVQNYAAMNMYKVPSKQRRTHSMT